MRAPHLIISSTLRLCAAALLTIGLAFAADPLSREQIAGSLSSGSLNEQELTTLIEASGVDFLLDDEAEAQLRSAGAGDALLDLIGRSGPEPDAVSPAGVGAPLGLTQIQIAIESGADQQRLAQMAQERGVDFVFTPELGRSLQSSGAGAELLAALALARVSGGDSSGGESYSEVLPEGYVPLPVAQAKDYDPFASQGRMDLKMFIDGVTEIRIRGDRIIHTNLQARLGRNAGTEMTQPLPSADLRSIVAVKKDGRGEFVLLQKPSSENDYQAILRIYDQKGGEDEYHIEIQWQRAE